MTKIQIYSHFKLPITMDPLKFGKLLDESNNKFIIQLSTKNIAVIKHYDKENFIRIFKNGDLVLEFRDKFMTENSFIRTINDTKFLFENDKLITTQIINALGSNTIFTNNNNPFYFTFETNNQIVSWFYLAYCHFKLLFFNYRGWSFIDWIITIYLYSIIFIIIFIIPSFIISNILFPTISQLDSCIINSFVFTSLLNKEMKGNIIKLRRTLKRNAWDEYKI